MIFALWLTVLTLLSQVHCTPSPGLDRYKRQIDDKELLNLSPEELCKDRLSEEYFRLTTEGDCRDVVRCDRAGLVGTIRLAAVRCPAGLAFDIDRQTCDWNSKVKNCDRLSSKEHYTSF